MRSWKLLTLNNKAFEISEKRLAILLHFKGKLNGPMSMELELVPVTKDDAEKILMFIRLGKDYFKDLDFEERERFMQSILSRLGEPDRWLFLLKYQNEYVGLAHVKIDKSERPGWGFILEFYIVPSKRRMGLGRKFFSLIEDLLRSKGVKDIWLLATEAIPFWCSLGFRLTGEIDKETGQMILTKSLRSADNSSLES